MESLGCQCNVLQRDPICLEQRQQRPHRAASELFKSATYANV